MELIEDNATAVQEHLIRLGWLTPEERVLELTAAGPGNMNRVLRARTGSRTLILKQAVPWVARYPQIAAPIERLDIEAAFYETIALSSTLSRYTPEVYGYDPRTHLLCLEDLGEGGDYTALYPLEESQADSQARSDARAGLSTEAQIPLPELGAWLGALHSIPVDDTLCSRFSNLAMRELNHAHIFEIPLQSGNGVEPLEGTAELAKAFAADSQLKEGAAQLGALYLQPAENAQRPALLHGDFYPGSWLKGDRADALSIIDPEFAFVGLPEFDLGVWLAHLRLLGGGEAMRRAALDAYPHGDSVDEALITRFAGMEIIRRLLGVARLPLRVDGSVYRSWLLEAREEVCA